jgi:hypothetical protein
MQDWLSTMPPRTIEYIVILSLKMDKWKIHDLSEFLPNLPGFLGNLIFATEKEA